MSRDIAILGVSIGAVAVALFAYAVCTWQSLASSAPWRVRLLALVPPAAPFVAWIAGRRAAPGAWLLASVAYVLLRVFSAG